MRTIFVEKNIPRMLLTKALAPRWPGFVWTPFSAGGYRELADLPLPGPRWIRVHNQACGICASDLSLLFVHADPGIGPAALPGLKRFFLGHETVCIVTEVGPEVTRYKPGDRVILDSHFYGGDCRTLEIYPPCAMCARQEYLFCLNKSDYEWRGLGGGFGDTVLTHEEGVHACADHLTADQAVLVEPLSVGVHTVLSHPPQPGDKVLVIGAGIIGLTVLMALRAACPEAEVSMLARYPFQAETAERLGARHILSGREGYAGVARLTGGKFFSAPLNRGIVLGGYDIVYDCVGNEHTVNDSLRWARAGGKVVLIGAHMAPMPNIDLTLVWYHQVSLVGTVAHGFDMLNGERRHSYDWVYEFFRLGKFKEDGLITHRFPFQEYKEAIRLASGAKGRQKAIKVIFEER